MKLRFYLLALCVGGVAWPYYGARFEPPDGSVYHGCGWNGDSSQARYSAMFPVNHHPLILQVVADMPGPRGFDVRRVMQSLTQPIVHPDSQFIEYGLHFRERDTTMLDSVFALTGEMDHYIDTLAIALRAVNRPFFLRIGFEFNGYWNPYHPYIFPLAFRKLATELRARAVPEFASVWCYEPDAAADFADSTAQGWKWYPGDDIVDWFGLDPFDMEHFNPALPDTQRGQITPKGKTEAFLRFAQQRGKPVYLNELSARHVFIVHDTLDPQGDSGRADWEYWFEPFFRFIHNHPDIKGWNYINLDWTRYEPYRTWGDARLQINSYIRFRWVDSLMAPRFLNVGYNITGVEEGRPPYAPSSTPYATVVSGVLRVSLSRTANSSQPELRLYDANGRKAMDLVPGVNDVRQLAPGVYFVRQCAAKQHSGRPVSDAIRVVVTR